MFLKAVGKDRDNWWSLFCTLALTTISFSRNITGYVDILCSIMETDVVIRLKEKTEGQVAENTEAVKSRVEYHICPASLLCIEPRACFFVFPLRATELATLADRLRPKPRRLCQQAAGC